MTGCMEPIFNNTNDYKRFNILDNYPRASSAVIDKAGHNLQIEKDKIFSSFVNELLIRVSEEF